MLGHSSLKTTRGYLHTVGGAINDMGAKIDGMTKEKEEKRKRKPKIKRKGRTRAYI
jgi:hypothetical protein